MILTYSAFLPASGNITSSDKNQYIVVRKNAAQMLISQQKNNYHPAGVSDGNILKNKPLLKLVISKTITTYTKVEICR